MPAFENLGAAPFVVITTLVTWFAAVWHYQAKERKEAIDRGDQLEIHRDGLTLNLLQSARDEMNQAREEADHLREEVRSLRAMEDHFYRFQQALDHLEALLFPDSPEARVLAERNARAFLSRMRKLKEEPTNE
jgi:hypothetical protein